MNHNDKKKKPNILWIMTDQQTFHMMSCTGNRDINTPNMDFLAKHGVRFDKTYCTNPVCLPSRFSLLTGRYPSSVGIRSNDYRKESDGLDASVLECALGTLLTSAGYNAVYGGKEHLPFVSAENLGFQYICNDEGEKLSQTCAQYLLDYKEEKPWMMLASFINPHDICLMAIHDFINDMEPEEAHGMQSYFKEAIEYITNMTKIPEEIGAEIFYEMLCPPLKDNYEPASDEPEAISILQQERIFKKLAREQYSDQQWRLHRYIYARLTEKVDQQIGRLIRAVLKTNQWDDTVIIFTSDHGDMDGSHKMEHKECLYEEACHVPLIIKGKNKVEGRVNDTLVCNGTDLFCTLLEYAQIVKIKGLEGFSLYSEVESGISFEKRNHIVIECENGIGVVGKDFKYISYDKGNNKEQFYDLYTNSGENYNQLQEIQYAPIIKQCCNIIRDHKKKNER